MVSCSIDARLLVLGLVLLVVLCFKLGVVFMLLLLVSLVALRGL